MARLRSDLEDSQASLLSSQGEKTNLTKQMAVFESKLATLKDEIADEKYRSSMLKSQFETALEEEKVKRKVAEDRVEIFKVQLQELKSAKEIKQPEAERSPKGQSSAEHEINQIVESLRKEV